ncbi:hypothetical protein RUE5091_00632 [Ruegeria denitrificans]|uniref:Uncharacterized protein n=1 Tax=Ruegeria denitrificans TaxID=1715692 RepID=A0A0P1I3K4_9RHOB|nr:hypothetical protein RUE5091_00632 [Ruegeria denitrificans]
MKKNFEPPNPRSRKPKEFKGTWQGRNYRHGFLKALSVNFSVFCVVFLAALYVVHLREQAKQSPRVWTLGSQ